MELLHEMCLIHVLLFGIAATATVQPKMPSILPEAAYSSGSLTMLEVLSNFDRFEDTALVLELLDGMYTELPTPKKKK